MDVNTYGWTRLFREVLFVDALQNDVRWVGTLPELLLFPVFAFRLTPYTSGTVTVHLRFGFDDADIAVSQQGIDFPPAGIGSRFVVRSPGWGPGVGTPGFPGQHNAVLPPRYAIRIDTVDNTRLTYSVHFAGIQGSG
jgi:hypothetical protein